MSHPLKRKLLAGTIIATPFLLALGITAPAQAQCVAAGSTVTCGAGQTTTDEIIGANLAVTLEPNHTLNHTGPGAQALLLSDSTVTLDAGSKLTSNARGLYATGGTTTVTMSGGAEIIADGRGLFGQVGAVTMDGASKITSTNDHAIYTYQHATITLDGGSELIATNGRGIYATDGATISLNGGSKISSTNNRALYLNDDSTITMDGGSEISSTNSTAVYALDNAVVTMDNGSKISGQNGIIAFSSSNVTLSNASEIQSQGGFALQNARILTTAAGTKIISNFGTAVTGTADDDTYIIAGNVSGGGGTAISLNDGDDSLTLNTGATITGDVDGGNGTDTLALDGTGALGTNFSNFENLTMKGTEWTLGGNHTFNAFNIDAGLLIADGTLTGDVNVNGGTLGGSGTITGNIINDATVAPGNSIGILTIIGNFTQNAGGTLTIEVDNAGGTDLLDINGTAALDGTVSFIALDNDLKIGQTYTFIKTTGGVTGNFSKIQDNHLTLDIGNVQIIGNDVQAEVIGGNQFLLAPLATDAGGHAAGAALDALIASGGGAIFNTAFDDLNDTETIRNVLASQSNVVQTSALSAAAAATGQVGNIARTRLTGYGGSSGISSGNDAAAIEPAAGGTLTAVWIDVAGGLGDVDGDAHARGADYTAYAVASGIERTDGHDSKTGIFVGLSQTDTDVDGLRDSAEVRSLHAGIYARRELGENWRLDGTLSGAWLDFETDRPLPTGTASASFDGASAAGQLEISYDYDVSQDVVMSTYAGIDGSVIWHDGYSESGAGIFDMTVDDGTSSQLFSELGVQSSHRVETDNWRLVPTARVGWRHQYLDRAPEISTHFSAAPAAAFKASGPERNRDSGRVMVELPAETISGKTALYTRYESTISSDAGDHLLKAGVKVKW